MNNLPAVAVLFLLGIIANCLSELLAYSPALTQRVLVFSTFASLILALVVLIASEIAAHRKTRRLHKPNREAKP
ncbi:hypothetical protein CWS43_26095 [Rahnella sp. AA]|uniref:hypothetical protein n=1 Tax=Rahnella sp. AA TaxID=2057180 RepID=UPI000C33197D|nr:hypothetical protein [Rahnella sp. AA]PKE27598.1 hypothetical protein CWS43_26095 [Rahnella sp. AA]